MKKISMAVGAVIALTGVTAPAQAQTLNWYGTSACFTGATPSGVSTVSPSNCAFGNSQTNTSIQWDTNDQLANSSLNFSITEDNSSNLPGALPSNTNSNRSINLSTPGNKFVYLGFLGFNKAGCPWYGCSSGTAESLNSVKLNLKLDFQGGSLDYSDMFVINMFEQSGPDGVTYNAGAWKDFTVGGQSYGFRISALDDYTNNSSRVLNAEDMYCQDGYRDENLATGAVNFTNDANRKLCGEFRVNSSPNIQTVPEPSTYALMGAGLLGIFGFARRRNRNA